MKIHKWKAAVVVVCVLAACICYSCSRLGAGSFIGEELAVSSFDVGADQTAVKEAVSEQGSDPVGSRLRSEEGGTGSSSAGGSSSEAGHNPDSGLSSTTAESVEEKQICYIHICGEVLSPGVYELGEGSRVFEAVEKAGGFTGEAAEEYLNMAQTISDGMKIVVPSRKQVEDGLFPELIPGAAAGVTGTAGIGKVQSGKVNLNTADQAQLMTLTGIGASRADAIVQYRQEHGKFQSIEDIMKVSGIKDGAFQKIKEDITV